MAITNQRTGYYGFTTDGAGSPANANGNVTKVLFTVQYPNRINDVEFTLSNGPEDWAAQMGDGTIVPINTPVVLFQNRDNSIIEFTLETPYPSNSPCVLVYRSDSAWFNIKEITGSRPWAPNTVSGHFGFTTEGYGGTPSGNGHVNRMVCAVPYPIQATDVEFTLSTDPSHWGARMGDGTIINLRDPVVLFSNRDSATVQFTMETPYPSNSPCILVYRSADAWFNVKVVTGDDKFVPVTNIRNVPSVIAAGVSVDLSVAAVEPSNASKQGIVWSVVSGPASVQGDSLLATAQGAIVLKATIEAAVDETTDYVQTFNIDATKNSITIVGQPDALVSVIVGEIDASITVNAKSDSGVLHYKWYRNTTNSTTGASAVSGAISSSYKLPTTLSKGDYFYFCEITSPGATTVNSAFSKVHVAPKLTGIEIIPRTPTLDLQQERQMAVVLTPVDADMPHITWECSNPDVVQISSEGKMFAMASGTVTITAKTDSLSNNLVINVPEFKAVKDITGIITSAVTNKAYTLTGIVTPNDATNKSITWSMLTANSTEATVVGNIFTAKKEGTAVIRATVAKGFTLQSDFTKDTVIEVSKAFVPVTDIALTGIPAETHADDQIHIECSITPNDSTNTVATFSLVSPGTTGAVLNGTTLTFRAAGTVTIRATVAKGASATSDYHKDFNITVLPAWVPVTLVELAPKEYDPSAVNGAPVELKTTVKPTNATKTDVVMKMIDASAAKAIFNSTNKTISVDPKNLAQGMETAVIMEIKVIDGVARGVDYVIKSPITITPLPPPEVYVPVTDVKLELPTPMRAWYPVLVNRVEVFPWNSNEKSLVWAKERAQEYMGADSNLFVPDPENPFTHKGKNPFFNWELDEPYLFAYDPGKTKLSLVIAKGIGPMPGDDYKQEYMLEFEPPYIPVKNVENVPLKIPCKTNIVLSGELDTMGGTGYHNPTWDEEIPSKTNLVWRLDNIHFDQSEYPNTAGAEIRNGNIVYADHPGKFTIQANVQDGVAETINWYYDSEDPDNGGRRQTGTAYNKLFTIEVVDEELPYDYPLMTLTLQSGKKIEVFRFCDLYNCCSDQPSTSTITIGGETFRKDQVTEVKFWEDHYVPGEPEIDDTIPATKIDGVINKIPSDFLGNIYYFNLSTNTTTLPADSTNTKVVWTCETSPDCTSTVTIKDGGDIGVIGTASSGTIDGPMEETDIYAGLPGEDVLVIDPISDDGYVLLTGRIKDGIGKGSDYVETFLIAFKNVDPEQTIAGGEVIPEISKVIEGTAGSTKILEANIFGAKAAWLISHYDSLVWELDGTYKSGTRISRKNLESVNDNNRQEAKLIIDAAERAGTKIKVKVSLKYSAEDEQTNPSYVEGTLAFEATAIVEVGAKPDDVLLPPPPVENLRNFGRNFTNLVKLDRIPETVTGDSCLRNFLWGCTSFNQELRIPEGVTGKYCLRYFLRECTKYDSLITIASTVTGEGCMYGFLYKCTSFNTSVELPSKLTGPSCLEKFMFGCEIFNQPLIIPSSVSGKACLRNFLTEAHSFNRPLTLPSSLDGENNIDLMLRDANAMISPITVSTEVAEKANGNGQTFSSVFGESNMVRLGVRIIGTGADALKAKLPNYLPAPPYRNLI